MTRGEAEAAIIKVWQETPPQVASMQSLAERHVRMLEAVGVLHVDDSTTDAATDTTLLTALQKLECEVSYRDDIARQGWITDRGAEQLIVGLRAHGLRIVKVGG